MTTEPTYACALDDAGLALRRGEIAADLLPRAVSAVELEDGVALHFPGDGAVFRAVADFVALERACCPFLSFEITVLQDGGEIVLRVRAPVGAREFLTGLLAVQS